MHRLTLIGLLLVTVGSCSGPEPSDYAYDRLKHGKFYSNRKPQPVQAFPVSTRPSRSLPPTSLGAFVPSINIRSGFIPAGRYGRSRTRRMNPRYITIHSTQNWSAGADAWQHAKALRRGALRTSSRKNRTGYLCWHFSVDESVAVQHLPTTEQGVHADFDGPGNKLSIGIEMCENRGNSRVATVERTARLTAYLMHKHRIPLNRVVPHYHWPRWGKKPPNKNCPHFLLENGRPGAKWRRFLNQVNRHYRRMG